MSTSPQTSEAHEADPHAHPPHARLDIREVGINDVTPYWRNPRRISDEAVNSVMQSIQRFGYTQPISVDKDLVIIAGHTRYSALRRMGEETIAVIVREDLSQTQVKQLRTIDNRTAEYTTWDFDKLMGEIEGLDQVLVAQFFPEYADTSASEAIEIEVNLSSEAGGPVVFEPHRLAEFVCPSCFHGWEVEISPSDLAGGVLNAPPKEA
jgi:ParB family chromosome partitioning protein